MVAARSVLCPVVVGRERELDETARRLAELEHILATAPPDQSRIIRALHDGSTNTLPRSRHVRTIDAACDPVAVRSEPQPWMTRMKRQTTSTRYHPTLTSTGQT